MKNQGIAKKMKIMETIQRELSKLGICLHVESTQAHPLNSRNVFVLMVQCIGIALNCVYIFHDAKTFNEYTISFYTASAMLTIAISFATLIWKMALLSKDLVSLEKIINESKSVSDCKPN